MGIFDEEMLTTKEVAAILRVHTTTVYRLIKTGRLPSIRVGSDYRVSSVRLEQLMQVPAEVVFDGHQRKRER